jgi:hypothetical protein
LISVREVGEKRTGNPILKAMVERKTYSAEVRAVTLLRKTSDNTQCTATTRAIADGESCPGSADLLGRSLGLLDGNLNT